MRHSPDIPMRFLIRGSAEEQVREFVSNHEACLALFAAADALQFGHVMGVPPYIYVRRLPRSNSEEWQELVPVFGSESPDLIVRKVHVPQSVFRGAVHRDGLVISDILQVWLDASAHPSRGEEQADLIHRSVLHKVIERGF